ncbi:hypothetical protein LIER_16781 [Lithospermum erythrorhizon]|uniref:Aminotransferase-like plant mobile domain-containing protein n=1 Tax=Lithospermum erythrorhizon TaxID=34254 RepID=A0AAV3Q889_LITER
MSWTLGEPSRAYFLAGRGHTRDKLLRIYHILREDIATWHWSSDSSISFHRLFKYTLGYWEWAEDVLSPCLAKLYTAGIYVACRFLLHVNHSLANSTSDRYVSPVEWINFWSALRRRYTGHLTVETNLEGSSYVPCYPRGSVPAHGSCSTASLRVFNHLWIPSSLVDEVYCWLSVFVLPLDVIGSIRPSVFKMVGCMAIGKTVSLGIPVLASIYRGLHLITTARYISNSSSCFPVHYLLGWMGSYLCTCPLMKRYPPGPYMVSLRTNMVGYREDAYFLLEAYSPHRFSMQLGFSPTIPGFKSKSRDTILAFEGLRYWRSCIANRLGQSVTFPSALDNVFYAESIRSAPPGPNKGKSVPHLPISVIPSSSKPLKKCSLTEDDSVDRDPKHAKWLSTRRPSPVARTFLLRLPRMSKWPCFRRLCHTRGMRLGQRMWIDEPSNIEASGEEAQTEVVDNEGQSDCMITEVVDVVGPAAPLPTGVQCIVSILRDSLKAAWGELFSFVVDKLPETLLVEEEGIMDSFEVLTRSSRQDLSSQGEKPKAVFSKARLVVDARCSVVPPEVHDRFIAIQIASVESSSKLQHKTEAIGSVCITLQ